jgi:hypothetical protein
LLGWSSQRVRDRVDRRHPSGSEKIRVGEVSSRKWQRVDTPEELATDDERRHPEDLMSDGFIRVGAQSGLCRGAVAVAIRLINAEIAAQPLPGCVLVGIMPLAPDVIHDAPNCAWRSVEGAQDAKGPNRIEGVNRREAKLDPAPLRLEEAQAVRVDPLRGDLGGAEVSM